MRGWIAADTAPGRLVPWLPIAFGTGIVLYFAADREPAWWAGAALALALATIAWRCRARPLAFPAAVALCTVAGGFAAASLKSARVDAPVLAVPLGYVALSGLVESREERERSDRIVLRIHDMQATRTGERLTRVRVSVRKGTAPAVGSWVSLHARLNPPLQPMRPGGYDFARDLYFQGIGASGFVLGRLVPIDPPASPDLSMRFAASVAAMRDAIDRRIRSVLQGDAGAIASALITGKRGAISGEVSEAMYVSSLAHVLSISGYHMAVVAGVVFFAVRALLALIPSLVARRPIKKWAALAALAAAAFYLLLSGAAVATQRAFIMTSIVLVGVMFDRPALTLRTIAVAALVVMLVSPEAIVHPSFQMSFAATLALIAAYERGLPWFSALPDTPRAARIALWGGREIAGLVIASLVAGLATTLYAAYHFHRLAPYGLLANLLAMPVVSTWVMPSGLLALLAIPFGFDAPLWRLMGAGIEWMAGAALWVAGLPGAVGRIAAFGTAPLLLGTAGIVLLCLLRSPLRFAGALAIAAAGIWAAMTPLPDIVVAPDGRAVAVRTAGGMLSVLKERQDDFVVREWLAADGDARGARDPSLAEGTRCDRHGCVAQLADGTVVALSFSAEGLAEDCERAKVVVAARAIPASCPALAVARDTLRSGGALTLRRTGETFGIERARAPGYDRPWARAPESQRGAMPQRRGADARDATPRVEDLEAEDR